jgi:large conductance mechanosensitive channel
MCVLINLSGIPQPSLTATKAVDAPTIICVVFLQATVDIIIIAFVVFTVVKQVNRFKKEAPPAPPAGPPQRREIIDEDPRRSEGRR